MSSRNESSDRAGRPSGTPRETRLRPWFASALPKLATTGSGRRWKGMTSRIDAVGNSRELFNPELPPIFPQQLGPPPAADRALAIDESLRNFIEASRAEQRSSELAQLGGVLSSPADVDAQRRASI